MDEKSDGQMDGRMAKWVERDDGWMDRWVEAWIDYRYRRQMIDRYQIDDRYQMDGQIDR